MGGVAGGTAPTLHFRIWVFSTDRISVPLQADFLGSERILGRDVLNRLRCCSRSGSEVVANP